MSRKGWLTALAFVGLAAPLGFALALWFGLDATTGVAENNDLLSDTLVVDRFSLFFKFLFIAVAGAVVLMSNDYVRRFERFQVGVFRPGPLFRYRK